MALIDDIYTFFKLAAKHPGIGHNPDADPSINHFFGFNFEEFDTNCAKSNSEDNSNFFPCLGLSDSPHSGLSGSFSSGFSETSMTSNLTINVLLLDKPTEEGDYEAEKTIYDNLYPVMQDIVNFIEWKVAQGRIAFGPRSNFPWLDQIDMTTMPFVRIGPKGVAKAYGYKLTLNFKQQTYADPNINPLISILV